MRGQHDRAGGTLTRSPPHRRPGGTTPGPCPLAPRFLPALQGRRLCRRAPRPTGGGGGGDSAGPRTPTTPPPPSPDEQPPPPPPPPPPTSLPDVFIRISAALNSRAAPRRRSPPRGRRRPQLKATRSVADMLRAYLPHAAADDVMVVAEAP